MSLCHLRSQSQTVVFGEHFYLTRSSNGPFKQPYSSYYQYKRTENSNTAPCAVAKLRKPALHKPLRLTSLANVLGSKYGPSRSSGAPARSALASPRPTALTPQFKAATISGNACLSSLFKSCNVILTLLVSSSKCSVMRLNDLH